MNELTAETLCINVLAALIGLSYPIFLQIITTLDSKYESVKIMQRFKQEKSFRLFSAAVVVMFGIMVYLPFAPDAPDGSYYLITHSARILALFWLLLTFIALIRLVNVTLIYFEPLALQKRIANKSEDIATDTERFSVFIDLLKFSMKVENLHLFLNCNIVYGECIGLSRKNAESAYSSVADNPDKNNLQKLVVKYPDYIYNANAEIVRLSIKLNSTNPYVANPVNFVTCVLDEYGHTIMSNESFSSLWLNTILMAKNGNKDWMLDYWTYALQLAQYTMDRRVHDYSLADNLRNAYRLEYDRFIELHYMLGAYLLYLDKMDVIEELLRFRISTSASMTLIPDTLQKVIKFLRNVDEKPGIGVYYLAASYPFFINKGVEDTSFIEGWAIKYCLYCLLKRQTENGTTATNIFEFDGTDSAEKNIIGRLRNVLYENIEYFTRKGFDRNNTAINVDLELQNIEKGIDDKIKNEISAITINPAELTKLEESTQKEFEKVVSRYPESSSSDEDKESFSFHFQSSVDLTKEILYFIGNSAVSSLAESVSGAFRQFSDFQYLRIIGQADYELCVEYTEIKKALDRLEINSDDYCLIGCGGISRYDATDIEHELIAGEPSILVIKRKDLTKVGRNPIVKIGQKTYGNDIRLSFESDIEMRCPVSFKYFRLIPVNSLYDGKQSNLKELKHICAYLD